MGQQDAAGDGAGDSGGKGGEGVVARTEVSRSRKAEHCSPTVSILCGFQVTEWALWEEGVPPVWILGLWGAGSREWH